MKKEPMAILLGFLGNQKDLIHRILKDIQVTEPDSREKISHLGYLLHNLYCALEDVFREVAQTFENQIEDPSRYHRELLKRMQWEIPQIRPALLTSRSYAILNELRGFRHVFRHAYEYELSADRLTQLRQKIIQDWESIQRDLDNFTDFLNNNLLRI
ncbi:MAG: hypothetical protein HY913_23330 [Desulfomonile tiedjei]|nr:hypothetical protein [Desulfomonile tiedjei]